METNASGVAHPALRNIPNPPKLNNQKLRNIEQIVFQGVQLVRGADGDVGHSLDRRDRRGLRVEVSGRGWGWS